MNKLLILYERDGGTINIKVSMDGEGYQDTMHFENVAYAEGMMTDEFHHATQNRYKEPSEPIIVHKRLIKKGA